MPDVRFFAKESLRRTVPALITVMCVVFSAVDFRLWGMGQISPMFSLIAVYYWANYSPQLLPPWFVLCLGLFQDAVQGTIFGLTSFILLLLWAIVATQRRFLVKESFAVSWAIFAFVSMLFTLLTGMVYSLFVGRIIEADPLFMQWIVTTIVYPFFHGIFLTLQLSLMRSHLRRW